MRLDSEQWKRVQNLFHRALDLPEPERHAFLTQECGEDRDLLAAVIALVESDEQESSLLDRDLASVADRPLDEVPTSLDSIGPYRLSRVLGQGGMGVVYLGEREDTGGKAAIKILRDGTLSPARRERFASEQRTLASLDHPSIARLYDANLLADGTPYFVMEYVEGAPLTEYCSFWKSSLRERLAIFRSACEAVQAAHQQAIVHRDLKPSNILVKTGGGLKLLDFGIAKQLEEPGVTADATQTALRLMTPAYAAPEQVRGGPIGIYTDIYALGVVLYELLSGRQPFDLKNRTPGEIELAISEEQPPRPSQVRTSGTNGGMVSATRGEWSDLDVMCMTAMHKDPGRRYRTVQGLIRDIDHFLRGEPLDAQPDSLGYRTGKFLRRHIRSVVAAVLVVAGGLALIGFYTIRLAAARDVAEAEAERTMRIQNFMLGLFQGGDESAGPADTLRVVSLIERGVREADMLDGEPAVQAELLNTLGELFQQLGRLDRADTLLQRALDNRRTVGDGDSPEVAESLVSIGALRVSQARLEDAEELVRQGLAMASASLPEDHPVVLEAKAALGRVLQEKGEYEGAVALLETVAQAYEATSPNGREYSGAVSELANTHFYAGDYGVADSLTRISLEIDRRSFGSSHPNVADGLINLGAVLFQRGSYEEAEQYYREALAIMESYYGSQHPETASALTMLSRSLNYQEKTDEALVHLQQARAIQLQVFGSTHPSVASTENEIGLIALMTGDLEQAEGSFLRMVEIYDSIYPLPHWLKGIARSNLAAVYLEGERHADAERLFRVATGIFSETLSPDDLNTGIARIKLGRSLVRQGRWSEAVVESRAGYEILSGITDPSVSWLHSARQDLAMAYEALGNTDQAVRFREEAEEYR